MYLWNQVCVYNFRLDLECPKPLHQSMLLLVAVLVTVLAWLGSKHKFAKYVKSYLKILL